MTEIITLEAVDRVEVITLYENLVSQTVASGELGMRPLMERVLSRRKILKA